MKIAVCVSAALVSVALYGPALADEAQVSVKPTAAVVVRQTPPQRPRSMEPMRVAMVDVVAEKRCINLLCPAYVVLGSGF